jgi:hypothetical protein
MREVYEAHVLEWVSSHHIHMKFHTVWFRQSKVDGGDTETQRQHGDRINLREVG